MGLYVTKFRDDGEADVVALDAPPARATTDGRTMSARGLLTAEVRDRAGDIVLVSGADLSSHQLNPVVLLDHSKNYHLPIGVTRSPDGLYTVEVDEDAGTIHQTTYFSQKSQMAAQVWELISEGILVGNSPGFRPIEVAELDDDDEAGFRSTWSNGQHRPAGKLIRRWELVEASWTGCPVNQEAARAAITKSWGGKPLSPVFVQAFQPWLPPRKVPTVVGGWDGGDLAAKAWSFVDGMDLHGPPSEAEKAWLYTESWDAEGKARAVGEVWQGQSGRWFTKREDNRVVPASKPGGDAGRPQPQTREQVREWEGRRREKHQGPQIPRGDVQKVSARLKAAAQGKPLPVEGGAEGEVDTPQTLATALRSLTVAQVAELKRELGLKASGVKAEYARKVAERAVALARAGEEKKAAQQAEKDRQAKMQQEAKAKADAKDAAVKDLPVFRRVNGWDIVRQDDDYVLRNPHTGEEVYRNNKYGRVQSVAADDGEAGRPPVPEKARAEDGKPGVQRDVSAAENVQVPEVQAGGPVGQEQPQPARKEGEVPPLRGQDGPQGVNPTGGFKVGQTLTYAGRAGSMPAEFRGFHSDPATGEKVARVIVRPEDGPPFEASVKPSELSAQPQQPPAASEPGFTGTDAQGREWVDGELVARGEEPKAEAAAAKPDAAKPAAPAAADVAADYERAATLDAAGLAEAMRRVEALPRGAAAEALAAMGFLVPRGTSDRKAKAEVARRIRDRLGATLRASMTDRYGDVTAPPPAKPAAKPDAAKPAAVWQAGTHYEPGGNDEQPYRAAEAALAAEPPPAGKDFAALPAAKQDEEVARAARIISEAFSRLGGVVKVHDVADAIRARYPGASADDVRRVLERMQADDQLTLQLVDSPTTERRAGEMYMTPRGVRGYVSLRPGVGERPAGAGAAAPAPQAQPQAASAPPPEGGAGKPPAGPPAAPPGKGGVPPEGEGPEEDAAALKARELELRQAQGRRAVSAEERAEWLGLPDRIKLAERAAKAKEAREAGRATAGLPLHERPAMHHVHDPEVRARHAARAEEEAKKAPWKSRQAVLDELALEEHGRAVQDALKAGKAVDDAQIAPHTVSGSKVAVNNFRAAHSPPRPPTRADRIRTLDLQLRTDPDELIDPVRKAGMRAELERLKAEEAAEAKPVAAAEKQPAKRTKMTRSLGRNKPAPGSARLLKVGHVTEDPETGQPAYVHAVRGPYYVSSDQIDDAHLGSGLKPGWHVEYDLRPVPPGGVPKGQKSADADSPWLARKAWSWLDAPQDAAPAPDATDAWSWLEDANG